MAKFTKKRGASKPEVSTASLPDIIFMLLFFFMVVTVLRDAELKVENNVPSATELTKLEKKSLVNHMFIGKPMTNYQKTYGTKPRLQLGDKFADISEIPLYLEKHRSTVPEVQRPGITTSLKVDGNVTMGVVSDVKTELRKSGQLKINYSAKKRVD
ncbi:MAG: biopolymer transporter ExbD [Saprospiraceae bacterium]|nr:biopolymer transporter ExbD [Bacteroidia bacterium]NNE15121.1 biopolymer transporter ExbD [Saprospiraceae bacterium]NNL91763.1 biopolymer transporter ExbD [Saprospiraceae bacterium]